MSSAEHEGGDSLKIAHLEEAQAVSLTGSFTWWKDSSRVELSAQARRILDLPQAEEVTLPNILARVHPEDVEAFQQTVVEAARAGQGPDFEHRLLLPDGTVKYVHTRARSLDGQGACFVGAILDITAHKLTELRLSESEYNYRNLFQAIAAAFWEVDFRGVGSLLRDLRKAGVTDYRRYFAKNPEFVRKMMEASIILDVNEQTLAIFGEGRKTHLPESVAPFWPVESESIYAESVLAAISGEPRFAAETVLCDINGRRFEALFTACFPPGSVAQGKLLIGVIDISERVRAQQQLNQLQTEFAHAARVSTLGELTASIAHEVNQPLTAIAMNASASQRWLSRPEPDLQEIRLLTERIIADAERAASIIARVRAMATRQVHDKAEIAIADAISDAMLFLRHEMNAAKSVLSFEAAMDLPAVYGDRTQIQQVIVNLTVNALQAMRQVDEKRRKLKVMVHEEDGFVVVGIGDSGPGIQPDHLPRLFESFFTTKEGGLGIGLAICRSIVEAHGGSISARDHEGGGALFELHLPVYVEGLHTDV